MGALVHMPMRRVQFVLKPEPRITFKMLRTSMTSRAAENYLPNKKEEGGGKKRAGIK